MTIETLRAQLPDYAKDLKLNLSSLLREETLTEQQLWGTLLASAIASSVTSSVHPFRSAHTAVASVKVEARLTRYIRARPP